jgi:N-methylhydantoinase A
LYGRCIGGVDIEALSWTLTITAPAPEPASFFAREKGSGAVSTIPTPVRMQSFFDSSTAERREVPVYLRETLQPGAQVGGPALIAEDQTTTVVTAHYDAAIDARGYIVLTRRREPSAGESS